MRRLVRRFGGAWLATAALGIALAGAPKLAAAADVPWLGVATQQLDDGLRDGMGYRGDGVVVTTVVDGSPADRAGIQKGDVIAAVEGRSIGSPTELIRTIRDSKIGDKVELTIYREGDRRTVTARLGSRSDEEIGDDTPVPPPPALRQHRHDDSSGSTDEEKGDDQNGGKDRDEDWKSPPGDFDVRIPKIDLNDDQTGVFLQGMGRGRLGVTISDDSRGSGARITEVNDDTPASRAGLRAGDVIVRVGDQEIQDSQDLSRAIREAPAGRIRMTVLRHGERRTFEPVLGERTARSMRRFTMGPGDRMMIRGPGDRMMIGGPDAMRRGATDQEMREEIRQLREEVRRLREELDRLEKR